MLNDIGLKERTGPLWPQGTWCIIQTRRGVTQLIQQQYLMDLNLGPALLGGKSARHCETQRKAWGLASSRAFDGAVWIQVCLNRKTFSDDCVKKKKKKKKSISLLKRWRWRRKATLITLWENQTSSVVLLQVHFKGHRFSQSSCRGSISAFTIRSRLTLLYTALFRVRYRRRALCCFT